MRDVERAGFEPRTLGTGAERAANCATRPGTGSFLVMANRFGVSAACVLSRGVAQGAQPSPRVFNTTFDPVHAVVRACRRGCTLLGSIALALVALQMTCLCTPMAQMPYQRWQFWSTSVNRGVLNLGKFRRIQNTT